MPPFCAQATPNDLDSEDQQAVGNTSLDEGDSILIHSTGSQANAKQQLIHGIARTVRTSKHVDETEEEDPEDDVSSDEEMAYFLGAEPCQEDEPSPDWMDTNPDIPVPDVAMEEVRTRFQTCPCFDAIHSRQI